MPTPNTILEDIRKLVNGEVMFWQKKAEAASADGDFDGCKNALAKQADALQRLQKIVG